MRAEVRIFLDCFPLPPDEGGSSLIPLSLSFLGLLFRLTIPNFWPGKLLGVFVFWGRDERCLWALLPQIFPRAIRVPLGVSQEIVFPVGVQDASVS